MIKPLDPQIIAQAIEGTDLNIRTFYLGMFGFFPLEFYSWKKKGKELKEWIDSNIPEYNVERISYVHSRNTEYKYVDRYHIYASIDKYLLEIDYVDGEDSGRINFLYDNKLDSGKISEIIYSIKSIPNYIEETKENNIKIICKGTYSGYYLDNCPIDPIDLSIDENYNDDFKEVDEIIMEDLDKSKASLFLFHGDPGTGKTSYIKSLVNKVKKKVIYIPPNMINAFADSSFIIFLKETCKNSIILVEDAEDALLSRNAVSHNQAINNILNFADGFMSSFNLQFICTFNCHESKIDQALLRGGRLTYMYKFGKLNKDKAQALSDKLGYTEKITEDTSLATIYNPLSNGVRKTKSAGFIR